MASSIFLETCEPDNQKKTGVTAGLWHFKKSIFQCKKNNNVFFSIHKSPAITTVLIGTSMKKIKFVVKKKHDSKQLDIIGLNHKMN